MPFRKHPPFRSRFVARFLPYAQSRRNPPPSVHLLSAVSTLPLPSTLVLSSPFSIPRVLFSNIEIDLVQGRGEVRYVLQEEKSSFRNNHPLRVRSSRCTLIYTYIYIYTSRGLWILFCREKFSCSICWRGINNEVLYLQSQHVNCDSEQPFILQSGKEYQYSRCARPFASLRSMRAIVFVEFSRSNPIFIFQAQYSTQ